MDAHGCALLATPTHRSIHQPIHVLFCRHPALPRLLELLEDPTHPPTAVLVLDTWIDLYLSEVLARRFSFCQKRCDGCYQYAIGQMESTIERWVRSGGRNQHHGFLASGRKPQIGLPGRELEQGCNYKSKTPQSVHAISTTTTDSLHHATHGQIKQRTTDHEGKHLTPLLNSLSKTEFFICHIIYYHTKRKQLNKVAFSVPSNSPRRSSPPPRFRKTSPSVPRSVVMRRFSVLPTSLPLSTIPSFTSPI